MIIFKINAFIFCILKTKNYFWCMDWLKSNFYNKSEFARAIGITPTLFHQKLHERQFNKFSESEIEALENIKTKLSKNDTDK